MPLSIVKRLSLGDLIPTTMSLQMEDRSMAQLEGIMENVLVKVGKFIFPNGLCGNRYGRRQTSAIISW